MSRLKRWGLVALLIPCGLAAIAAILPDRRPWHLSGPTIRIGVLTDLSRPEQISQSIGLVLAATLAIENQDDEIGPAKLEVWSADTGGNPARAQAILERWTRQNGITAVLSDPRWAETIHNSGALDLPLQPPACLDTARNSPGTETAWQAKFTERNRDQAPDALAKAGYGAVQRYLDAMIRLHSDAAAPITAQLTGCAGSAEAGL